MVHRLVFRQSVANHRGEKKSNIGQSHIPRENTHHEMVSPVGTRRVVGAMIARWQGFYFLFSVCRLADLF